jgi:two-component system response regulator CpxR
VRLLFRFRTCGFEGFRRLSPIPTTPRRRAPSGNRTLRAGLFPEGRKNRNLSKVPGQRLTTENDYDPRFQPISHRLSEQCAKTEDVMAGRRVLIIDDDAELGELLGEFLANEDFTLEFAEDGASGLRKALTGGYALIVLDVMLPGLNGFEVLRQLRAQSQVPVLMLTARGDDVDRIVGLEIGADDYLPKPFNPRELVARVHAILRRMMTKPELAAPETELISVGDVELEPRARMVRRNGQIVDLTTAEFDLLRVLLQQAGQVVPREQLFQEVLGREFAVFDRSIDNHVSSLRRKLGARINGIDRIKSVRNVGYQYAVVSDNL